MSFGRIKKEPAKDYVKYMVAPRLEEAKHRFPAEVLIHRAHVVMLCEKGILKKDEATQILKCLRSIERAGIETLGLKPSDDLYMATESYIIKQIGDVGGKMHIGRSRNDLSATANRIYVREKINEVIEDLIRFRNSLLNVAENNLDTVMPGYTHWQQAQPVTFAHYLVAHVDACERDLIRLENAYRNTNLNTLGAAALAGTSFPLDRQRTTQLLGFDGILENSYDAVGSRDYVAETAAAFAILMSNLSRLAEDLLIWVTNEFSMIDLSEEYAGTSSIMPQKKNPTTLEITRARAASVIGSLTGLLAMLKGIPYTNVVDWGELNTVFHGSLDLTTACVRVMAGVVSTLSVNKELMLERATKGFSTMTDLADTIVRERNLSFRVAHEIVAEVVTEALEQGKTGDEITGRMIDDASSKVLGKALQLSDDSIRKALQAVENVRARAIMGGPAPKEVKRMVDDRRRRIRDEQGRLESRRMKLKQAKKMLEESEEKILSNT